MADIIIGLQEVKVGTAAPDGSLTGLTSATKLFKVYQNSCTISTDDPDITEFYEENKSVPEETIETKKSPVISLKVMDVSPENVKLLIGGDTVDTTGVGFDGSEAVDNKLLHFVTLKGSDIIVPNAKIVGKLDGELSKKELMAIDVKIYPQAVSGTGNKPFVMKPKTVA